MARTKTADRDMTQGGIFRALLLFSLPLLAGNFFQQCYNTVDSIVLGNFVGKAALAAVGTTTPIINTLIGLFLGLSAGIGVVISQFYGAKEEEKVGQAVQTSLLLVLLLCGVFTAVGIAMVPGMLRLMATPADVFPQAARYLRIYFAGVSGLMLYNLGAGILRAVGDARRPLYFLIAASLCNIVLDLVLVVGFGLAVLGVALATVLSQLLSAVLVVLSLMRSQGQAYQLFPRQLRLYGAPLKDAMRVGVPAALQSVMYSASNIVIQAAINSFGTDAVAAWTAYGKMDVIFWMSINAMALAITTFAGQNYGAGQYDRLKKGVRVSVGMSAGFTVLLSTAMTVFARPILSIFSPDPDVLEIGVAMVRFLAPCYITYILVELLPGAIRGAGRSMVPMLISVFGVCVLRLVWLFTVVPAHHTIEAVELSYPITWAVTSAAVLIYYRWGHWLQPRNGTE